MRTRTRMPAGLLELPPPDAPQSPQSLLAAAEPPPEPFLDEEVDGFEAARADGGGTTNGFPSTSARSLSR